MRLMRPRLIWPMRMQPTKSLLMRPRLIWPMRMWPTKLLRPTISPSQNTIHGVNCSIVFEVATINWAEWCWTASAPLTINICWGLMQVLMVSITLIGSTVSNLLWPFIMAGACKLRGNTVPNSLWFFIVAGAHELSRSKVSNLLCFLIVAEAREVICTFDLHSALPQVNRHIIQDRCNNQLECGRRLVLLDLICWARCKWLILHFVDLHSALPLVNQLRSHIVNKWLALPQVVHWIWWSW